jgi:hypothetical protein
MGATVAGGAAPESLEVVDEVLPSSRGRLLWLAWSALVVLVVSFCAVRVIADGPYGKDTSMFLTGGHLIAGGQLDRLYDLTLQTQMQDSIGGGFRYIGGLLPFNYPPYVGAVFVPLAYVSPDVAHYVWVGVQIVVLVSLIFWAVRSFPSWGFAAPYNVPLAFLAFQPFVETLLMGQISIVLLALWWWTLVSWKNERWVMLGIAVGLAAFKPQLVALLVVALLVDRRWRSLMFAALTQAVLWLGAVLVAGPGIIVGYVDMLRTSAMVVNTMGFVPSSMPSLRGLLTVLGVSSEATMWPALVGWVAGLALTALVWRTSRPLEAKFGLTAVLAVLLSPHLHVHDASLLVAATLCALLMTRDTLRAERRLNLLFVPFVLMFASMYLLVFQLSKSHAPMILSVWLLAMLLVWMLWWRKSERRGIPVTPIATVK